MLVLRISTILLTQLPLLYFELGTRDLLGGFNQSDAGFSMLVLLFFTVPLLNLGWLCAETWRSIRILRSGAPFRKAALSLLPLLFLTEALVVDLYLLTHIRM